MAPKKQTKEKAKPLTEVSEPSIVPSSEIVASLPEKLLSEVSLELLATIAAQVYPHVGGNLKSADREQRSVSVAAGILKCAARALEKSSALPPKEHYTFNEIVTELTGDSHTTRATQAFVKFLGWKRPFSVDRKRYPKITAKEAAAAQKARQGEIASDLENLKQKGFTLKEVERERAAWAKYKQGLKYDWLEFQKKFLGDQI